MTRFPAFLPKLSQYDPAEASEGSIDPLGLAQLATNLGDALIPGFTERSRRPRFLVALAVGARVLERPQYEDGAYAEHTDGPANIAFERLLLESFARVGEPGDPGLIGIPGIGKARDAAKNDVRLSSARYLVAPGAVGLWVAYKRLARQLGVLDDSGHLLEKGNELLHAWESGIGRPGFVTGTGEATRALLSEIDDALLPLLGDEPARSQPRRIWREFHEHLRPHGLTSSEAKLLRTFLVDGDLDRGDVFRAIEGGKHDASEQLELGEVEVLRALEQSAGPDTVARVRAILAFERVAGLLTRALRCILYAGGRRADGRVDFASLNADADAGPVFATTPAELERALALVHPLLQAVDESSAADDALGWLDSGALASPRAFFDALLRRHFETQRRKPPEGKRPWIEGDGTAYFVRTRYAVPEPPEELLQVHPYRTRSVRNMLADLQGAER